MLFGGVEVGGTTVVCAVGTSPTDLRDRVVIATTDPAATIARIVEHLSRHEGHLAAVGLASFGPLELDPRSPRYGRIAATPKPGWAGADLIGPLADGLGVPIALDTDVNGAALAEGRWGAARGLDTFVYLTAGTGIGGGGLAGGRRLHGLSHPEMGHMRIPRHPEDPLQHGACPFHRDCWEGWAARAAIERRWGAGRQATDLTAPADLGLLAHYLAAGVANVICALSPQRVVLGGGIVLGGGDARHRERLLGLVRREIRALLGGYLEAPELGDQIDRYVVAPALGTDAGVLGAIALAQDEATATSRRA
jgi:fructokinase